ncbi:MAG TPA: ABC transporter ATP-binding protein [Gemmatimonadaceae bacterium]|nr:ABC transporter ATP-binding protein [Gemmatimonadaceae bacterium]
MIQFNDVGKTYRSITGRTVRAVDGFTLDIPRGEVFGIAGPNGAGKSTLIGMLLGFLHPSRGTVRLSGLVPRSYIERNGIGYLSELITMNKRWRLDTALVRYAILADIPRERVPESVERVIATLGLDEHRRKSVKALSKGNLQRLGLAQALLRDEELLILDEPTHGLDPVWTQRFRDIVNGLRDPGRTIIIASHNLDELQRLADRVAIIDHGRLQRVVGTGSMDSQATGALTYRISLASGVEEFTRVFPGAVSLGRGELEVVVAGLDELNAKLRELIIAGAVVAAVVPTRSALEQQFREAVGEPS